ncbi:uncharacterized protein Obp19d [Palaemon carinicauda]|uniref:uncharacterized protein Obp19d n=1 Tax=Palaemon carinicauda TaxID=392227 RepID=UPI0035B5F2B7
MQMKLFLLTAVLYNAIPVYSSPKRGVVNEETRCLSLMKPRKEPNGTTEGAATLNAMCSAQTGVNTQGNGGTEEDSVRLVSDEMKDHNSNCALSIAMMEKGLLDQGGKINSTAAQDFLSETITFNLGSNDMAVYMKEQVPMCVQNTTEEQFPILRYQECILNSCKKALLTTR